MPPGTYKRTKKHRDQTSNRMRQLWLNPEYRKKMLEVISYQFFQKGHSTSAITGSKISEALKGHRRSKSTKQKLSKAKLIHPVKYWLGKHLSDAHKRKIGKAGQGKHFHSQEIVRKILTRRIPSSLEEKFQIIINSFDLPYKYVGDGSFFIENYNPDFINTNHEKTAVEVYSRFYKLRSVGDIKIWKRKRTRIFKKYGWRVIYFDEAQVNEQFVLKTLKGGD